MFKEITLVCVLIFQTGWGSNIAGVKTSEKFVHSMVLDSTGNYILFWNFNETHITFEVHVQTKGTNRIIFAYGDHDPADDNSIFYHGTTRGTKSASLLSTETVNEKLPDDSIHYDFLNNNYLVPSGTTTYWCKGFKMPALGKHHMIKFEALVTPGNELNVHHIVVYRCNIDNPDKWDGKNDLCYDVHRTLPQCTNVVVAWAIGGEPFYFPDHVGVSFGGPEDEIFYIMETHYDNPTRKAGMVDNSGIRITMTPTLRQHEAGMLQLGHTSNFYQVIPPGLKNFVSKSYCREECMNKGFQQGNLTEVKVIAGFQHSHLLGRAITTRHYRNGTEIKPIITDPHYDFDFQEIRLLPKEVSLYPGDSFRVECTYDSTDRTTATVGGLSTREEMCLSFLYYYPNMPVANCLSMPLFDNFNIGFREVYHYIHTADWQNQTVVDDFLAKIDDSQLYDICMGPKLKVKSQVPEAFKPTKTTEYVPPAQVCS